MTFCAEPFDQSRLMPRRQRLGARQQRSSLRRELQGVAAAVGRGRQALDEAPRFEPVQEAHKPRPLDPREDASSACESPRLAPTTASTENCAGRMSILASVLMKSWKTQT